jgi:poly-gamma-glutamate synthesis protein (capsule biosynthesis protein)
VTGVTPFLCGDVMTGRGVDQLLAHPGDPSLREDYLKDAREYLDLAADANGPVPRPVAPAYIWGDALAALDREAPAARIVNLETSVTASDRFWPDKGIHYRMRPRNIEALAAARLDVCVLSNNHVLDFDRPGLEETLATLHAAGLRTAGAGRDLAEARAPASVPLSGGGALHVFGLASPTSGVPAEWAAGPGLPGVDLLSELSDGAADEVAGRVRAARRPGDLAVVSIHWGSNWGFEIPAAQVRFAHRLVDGGVDLVHGHSSHHVRPFEVYRGHLVLYGCGDFLSDYEGIRGYEAFRGELAVAYLPTLDAGGRVSRLKLLPFRLRRLRLERASRDDTAWLADTLNRTGAEFASAVAIAPDGALLGRLGEPTAPGQPPGGRRGAGYGAR